MTCRTLPYYEFERGIFEIDEFDCASVFVIVGSERALVFDTGTGIGDLRWVVENRITDRPYDVVLTHNHGDHIGGAGFFDEVWIHKNDFDWTNLDVAPTLEFRKAYARMIRDREGKNYSYDDRDIVPWIAPPAKRVLEDGQVFDLGGRKVTFYHCPGHTAGECVAVDDLTRTLFIGDACNRNLLLGLGVGKDARETILIAHAGLQKIYAMRDSYDHVYNSHHDFRGFGSPLGAEVFPDAIECLRTLLDGKARLMDVPDFLTGGGAMKKVAVYGSVQISLMGGGIEPFGALV
jgi:glyoxylase-like metal-dependent hydrolase (beta-lactamase superfamily II)